MRACVQWDQKHLLDKIRTLKPVCVCVWVGGWVGVGVEVCVRVWVATILTLAITLSSNPSSSPSPLRWEAAKIGTTDVVKTKLSPAVAAALAKAGGMQSLFVDGRRQVLARWPNGNPEKDLFPSGYATGAWGPFRDMGTGTHTSLATPIRVKDSGGGKDHFDNCTCACDFCVGAGQRGFGQHGQRRRDVGCGVWCAAVCVSTAVIVVNVLCD